MISDVFFPRINGVSTSIHTFGTKLQELGVDVTLIAPEYAQPPVTDFKVVTVPSWPVPRDPEDRIMNFQRMLRCSEQLSSAFSLVHIHTPFVAHYAGIRIAQRLGVPAVETYHTLFEGYFHHYLPFIPSAWLQGAARRLSRRQCNAADGIIAPTEPLAETLRGYGVTQPIEVIPTGIDVAPLQAGDRASFRLRHGIPPDRPVMLYLGRVAFEKNLGFLLNVVSAVREVIPDILLLVAGEGPAEAWVKAETERLGLGRSIKMVGYLSRDTELADCYHAADVFVFASRTETQGLVLLEAMATGLPVVSTAVLGTRAVMENTRGGVVASEEVDDFSEKVIQVLRSPVLRAELSREGQDSVRGWDAAAQAERLHDYYLRILRSATQAA